MLLQRLWTARTRKATRLRNRYHTTNALMVGTIALCLVLLALQIYSLNLVIETRLILSDIIPTR